MALTERDRAIVAQVHRHRFLSAQQVEVLLFPSERPRGKRTVCQRRLQLLYHHQYLARVPEWVMMGEGRRPLVYALDERGANLIAEQQGIDRAGLVWRPTHNDVTPLFLQHTLAINDVRVVVQLLASQDYWTCGQWIDEKAFQQTERRGQVPFHQRGARLTRTYPDGYFTLRLPRTRSQAHFFLEVDMGTMTNTRWQEKVRSYVYFRESGLADKYYGTRRFRVLAVTTTNRRLKNLKRATERAGGDRFFWFAQQDTVDIWEPSTLLGKRWRAATQQEPLALFGDTPLKPRPG